jgi:hypothetical protein
MHSIAAVDPRAVFLEKLNTVLELVAAKKGVSVVRLLREARESLPGSAKHWRNERLPLDKRNVADWQFKLIRDRVLRGNAPDAQLEELSTYYENCYAPLIRKYDGRGSVLRGLTQKRSEEIVEDILSKHKFERGWLHNSADLQDFIVQALAHDLDNNRYLDVARNGFAIYKVIQRSKDTNYWSAHKLLQDTLFVAAVENHDLALAEFLISLAYRDMNLVPNCPDVRQTHTLRRRIWQLLTGSEHFTPSLNFSRL